MECVKLPRKRINDNIMLSTDNAFSVDNMMKYYQLKAPASDNMLAVFSM
jgi:hypothetical protein